MKRNENENENENENGKELGGIHIVAVYLLIFLIRFAISYFGRP